LSSKNSESAQPTPAILIDGPAAFGFEVAGWRYNAGMSRVRRNGNIYFSAGRTARPDSSGNVHYCFSDHLGTSRVISNE
jgi:hypothetical protein